MDTNDKKNAQKAVLYMEDLTTRACSSHFAPTYEEVQALRAFAQLFNEDLARRYGLKRYPDEQAEPMGELPKYEREQLDNDVCGYVLEQIPN